MTTLPPRLHLKAVQTRPFDQKTGQVLFFLFLGCCILRKRILQCLQHTWHSLKQMRSFSDFVFFNLSTFIIIVSYSFD